MIPAILARDLRKSFGSVSVLRGVSLDVQPGEVFGIIGPSGSGKSTFLRCLNSLETIDSGDLYVNGEFVGYCFERGNLRELSDREQSAQRMRIGMVFQRFNLFAHMTALENVTSGPIIVKKLSRVDAGEQGRHLLDQVGLAGLYDRYPVQLSGGQQQRVAIARAMAMDPEILLFDEPTSALDPELVDEVLETIRQLAQQGRTMVVVTHELLFARDVCDRIAFMDQGQLIECAPAEDLFATPQKQRTRDFLQRFNVSEPS
ncbi:amino acid ABC transporter ATP-binding protein [Microvirga brassicacearum]|uniref:Amino acid ABC transporter ATP-binding protein n=1 Tax=Microvirga brassicacearum TaxID=2580413 RepID=A0A5N3PEB9_9HYPH|nr:amino acid ABC transporter ATP-binding protein [Microvirga brassicacearum]KAB0268059.1 amino acid ABC transporter ATP-binding protein [Microvirga brassicacearum]